VEVLWAQFYKNCRNTNKGPLVDMMWINFMKFIAINKAMYGITPKKKRVIGDGCHIKGHTINH
jgi:transcriptional regulator of NAD metabolism